MRGGAAVGRKTLFARPCFDIAADRQTKVEFAEIVDKVIEFSYAPI
jgi:hypothetical protein